MRFYCQPLPYCTDATAYYVALSDLPWPAWLDSGGMGRYDILTAAPYHTIQLRVAEREGDPFALLRSELGASVAPVPGIPFAGGALGYWGYDLARETMGLIMAPSDRHSPDMAVGLYDWALVLDHHQRTAQLVSHRRREETTAVLHEILLRLQGAQAFAEDTFQVGGKITANMSAEQYMQAFFAVQRYLHAGDCYQVNLAQRFCALARGDALGAYRALRRMSPAPYSAFLSFSGTQVLCASPERFLHVHNGRVETRPIKGTRPRSPDAEKDRQLADELRQHPKDRAENLMIVDLLRSDLGRNCTPGSVCAVNLFEVESFANVHHLVSVVEGQIAPGRDALDVLRDCFPGGSITGAPKQRAMQIIDDLEPNRRGVYCGAIGYVGFDGNMDTNIAIRTLVYAGGEICCWAGGGIVADSEGAAEYQETFDKAALMLRLLEQYGGQL
jgi:para-aminobenzoate synthetase component 1